MAFLAAMALAGVVGAEALARHWRLGPAATLTVQVPDPTPNRVGDVLTLLRATPGIAAARSLDPAEMEALLRPWLGPGLGNSGTRIALPLPAVIEVRLDGAAPDSAALAGRLDAAAPGTLVEANATSLRRLAVLARSVQACAALAMAVVAFTAVAVVTVATRAGLATRRDAIEIVHGLGATDGFIANQFARRTTALAGWGALAGAALALPVLAALTTLAAPFVGAEAPSGTARALAALPSPLWLAIPAFPVLAAAIGWTTAQWTVRHWLRRLP